MSGSAIAMMVSICTLLWGGFLFLLGFIWKLEKKRDEGRPDAARKTNPDI